MMSLPENDSHWKLSLDLLLFKSREKKEEENQKKRKKIGEKLGKKGIK